ncbi:MAG TPA: hypothetical protein VIM65_08555 [Cyclobacteriaceae bacterium]
MVRGILILNLKADDLINISEKEYHRYDAVVDGKLGKGSGECSYKRKSVTITDITGNLKGRGESGASQPHDKEAGEINFVEIFRIKKKIGYAQVFTKAARDESEEYNPA